MQEDNKIEFKSNFSEAVIESLVAFANTKGGKVLIGIDNKGNPVNNFIIGSESLQTWVNEIKNKTQPSIIPDAEVIQIQGKNIACLSVQEFPVKPVAFRGRYFKRINNSNHQLSIVEIADLSLQSLQISWDAYPAHGRTIADIDLEKVEKFVKKVNEAGRFLLEDTTMANLEKLKFIKGETITNAACLLFGKQATGYNIHLGRFKTPTFIIDDKMLNGTLFEMVEETMRYLVSWFKVAFEIKGMPTQRTEIFEYPLPALREIVLNALIHRDYLSPADVQIKIFDNNISFFNPGKLFGDQTVNDLKKIAIRHSLVIS
jgi:ATP-dependent DNA helicase RecG